MVDSEEWIKEQERVEELNGSVKENHPFGYRYIMEELDIIVALMCNRQHTAGYIKLGVLRQEILTSKEFINEE